MSTLVMDEYEYIAKAEYKYILMSTSKSMSTFFL